MTGRIPGRSPSTGPATGPPAPPGFGPAPVQPLWSSPMRGRTGTVATVLLIIISAGVLLLVGTLLLAGLGAPAFILCGVLALVPLGICLLGLHWVDRWEPEPRSALLFAFLWGAGVSVGITLALGPLVNEVLIGVLPLASADLLGTVVQAPVVEEFTKGLGVLILVFVRRSHFDGPVDGIVYAGTVAAGFAFTENIAYFGSAVNSAGGVSLDLGFIFILRGLFSPFAHVMFTSFIGLALGLAVRRYRTPGILLAFLLGLVPAVVGHMFWNGGMTLLFDNFFAFYFLSQVPLFALTVLGVQLLRRAERRLTEQRLGEYAAAGWFTDREVALLSTRAGRHQALAWAAANGTRREMKRFIRDSTRLALVRQQLAAGRSPEANAAAERALLADLTRLRASLLARAGRY